MASGHAQQQLDELKELSFSVRMRFTRSGWLMLLVRMTEHQALPCEFSAPQPQVALREALDYARAYHARAPAAESAASLVAH